MTYFLLFVYEQNHLSKIEVIIRLYTQLASTALLVAYQTYFELTECWFTCTCESTALRNEICYSLCCGLLSRDQSSCFKTDKNTLSIGAA